MICLKGIKTVVLNLISSCYLVVYCIPLSKKAVFLVGEIIYMSHFTCHNAVHFVSFGPVNF